jgi:asparagine synthase (glutamine-hydrolysing)
MTMAHGLELRSPFLDHRLVEFMAMIPSQWKIRDHELKYILRQAAKRYLPPAIANRPKQGFMFPVAYWFRDRLYPLLKSLLPNGRLVQERLLRPQTVLRLLEEHRSNRIDHHVRLWMLLNLEIWYQMYVDQVPRDAVTQPLHAYAAPASHPAFSR